MRTSTQLSASWTCWFIGAALLWLASLSGCFMERTCEDIGCANNLTCNTETGECEEVVTHCAQTGCDEGERCDPNGLCQPIGASCATQGCPTNQVCNAQTGFCEARSNCEIDPCTSPAERCDPTSGLCVPAPCGGESDCPPAYYCSNNNVCRPGCRLAATDACPPGEFCRGNVGDTIGQCREECDADEECPLGQLCEVTREGSSCEPEPPCGEDDDCRADGVCRDRICQVPPCRSDADCTAEEVCDVATGSCIGGNCEEDIHAPNQDVGNAAELNLGTQTSLQLCPGKSDWFSFYLRSSDALQIRLEHAPSSDIDLFVYAADGRLLASNQQSGSVTTLQFVSQRSQTAYIEIESTGSDGEQYDLEIDLNPDRLFCSDDTSEENDRASEAVSLPTDATGPFEALFSLCGPDEDWFELPRLTRSQGLSVRLTDADQHVAADLLTPDQRVFALVSPQDGDDSELSLLRLGVDGDYLLRLRSRLGRSSAYRLRTRVRAPYDCPDASAHDTAESALAIPMNAVQSLPLCPLEDGWEVDWLALAPAEFDGMLSTQVVALGDLPPLDVVLFRRTPGGLEPVRRATERDGYYQLEAAVADGDEYLVRLSSSGELGRIRDGVNYQVFYRFESSD